ncbi:MAG: cation-transporting P-type ATPase [Gammaproteobacteria bacterium]
MRRLTDLDSSESVTTRPWHVLSQETAFNELGAAATGLDTAEASQRIERYGPNRLPEAPPRSPLMRLLAQFHNLLIYVLLGAALIAGAMGHLVDTIVILGVVLAMIGLTAWARPAMLPAWAGRGACAMNQCRVAVIAL